jgi:hypothetical protein
MQDINGLGDLLDGKLVLHFFSHFHEFLSVPWCLGGSITLINILQVFRIS